MTVEEIKGTILELTKDVTEDNVSAIASTLNELNQFIHARFSNSALAREFDQLPNVTRGKIKSLEESNQKLAEQIESFKAFLDQEDEIERKHLQLISEKEKLKALAEKQKAIEELSKIQKEVLQLTKLNNASMLVNIENLKNLNTVLANANTTLEQTFAANVLTAEKNLSAIQKNQLIALNKIDKTQLVIFGEEFMMKVTSLINDYNNYAERINQHRTNQEEVIALFKAHHSENISIQEALKNRNEALGNLENLNREINERLDKYDKEIKSLVEKRDQLPIYQLAEARKYQ